MTVPFRLLCLLVALVAACADDGTGDDEVAATESSESASTGDDVDESAEGSSSSMGDTADTTVGSDETTQTETSTGDGDSDGETCVFDNSMFDDGCVFAP